MSLEFVGREEARNINELAHPIWIEVFGPMITGGIPETERIFRSWLNPEEIARTMDGGRRYAYVKEKGETIGFAAVDIEPGGAMFISKIYLKKEFRGKGFGSEALRDLVEYGRVNGCSVAYLHVNVKNAEAIKAYERNGFERKVHEITYLGDGDCINDYHMYRSI